MKIEEPKTPYSYYVDDEGGANSDNEAPNEINPENLTELLNRKSQQSPSKFPFDDIEDEQNEEEFENETEEERAKRMEFEQKRKKHYNEYQMVKLARKLMKEELGEQEEDDDQAGESKEFTPGQSCSH